MNPVRPSVLGQPTSEFRSLLQNVVCERYTDRDAAFAAIDTSYQAGRISQREQRALECQVELMH